MLDMLEYIIIYPAVRYYNLNSNVESTPWVCTKAMHVNIFVSNISITYFFYFYTNNGSKPIILIKSLQHYFLNKFKCNC